MVALVTWDKCDDDTSTVVTYSSLIPPSCLVIFLATLKIVPRHLARDMTDLNISAIVTPSCPHFLSPLHQAVCHQGALQSPHHSATNRVDGAERESDLGLYT